MEIPVCCQAGIPSEIAFGVFFVLSECLFRKRYQEGLLTAQQRKGCCEMEKWEKGRIMRFFEVS